MELVARLKNIAFRLQNKTKYILDIGSQLMTSFEGASHCEINDYDF